VWFYLQDPPYTVGTCLFLLILQDGRNVGGQVAMCRFAEGTKERASGRDCCVCVLGVWYGVANPVV
jgi:hypothetical protein